MNGKRTGRMYTADRRLYLDDEGKVCEANSPRRVRLLVPAGGKLPIELAERLGLVETEQLAPGLDRENGVSVDHPLYRFMIDEEPGTVEEGTADSGRPTAGDESNVTNDFEGDAGDALVDDERPAPEDIVPTTKGGTHAPPTAPKGGTTTPALPSQG